MASRPSYYFNQGHNPNQGQSQYEMGGTTNPHSETMNIITPDNVIIARGSKLPKFYVFLAKQMFHNQKFEVVELHGYGEEGIQVAAIATELITRLGYAEICKIKTGHGCFAGRRITKLIVHLTKTQEFERLYKEFQDSWTNGERGGRENVKSVATEDKAGSEQKARKGKEDCQIEERVQEEDEEDEDSNQRLAGEAKDKEEAASEEKKEGEEGGVTPKNESSATDGEEDGGKEEFQVVNGENCHVNHQEAN